MVAKYLRVYACCIETSFLASRAPKVLGSCGLQRKPGENDTKPQNAPRAEAAPPATSRGRVTRHPRRMHFKEKELPMWIPL